MKNWVVLVIVMVVGVSVDQYTKFLADSYLQNRPTVIIIDGFFDLRYSRNPGAFFSFGATMPDSFRIIFFIIGSVLAIVCIAYMFRRSTPTQRALRWALIFLLSGAMGNLIDRILFGEVIDFFHLHLQERFHWATFNVADICIVIGLGLLIIDLFRPGSSKAPSSI